MLTWIKRLGPEIALLLVIIVLFGWQLGKGSLVGDEAIYAAVARSILNTGDWVTLHLNGAPWYEKPPLGIWLTAIFFKAFGISSLTARLGAMLGATGCCIMIYLIGRRLFSRIIGLLAAAILALTAPVLFTARFGNLDALLTFWIYLALYATLRARSNLRWWLLVGFACGGAIMTKGAAGLFAPLMILAISFVDPTKLGRSFYRYVGGGALVALLVALPWHLAELIADSRGFLSSYIGYHVLDRTSRPLEGHVGGIFFYLGILIHTYEPWLLLALTALVYLLASRRYSRLQRAIIIVPVTIVTILTAIMATKQDWYYLPAYPALALLIAAVAIDLFKGYDVTKWIVGATVVLGILAVIAVPHLRRYAANYLGHTYNRPVTAQAVVASAASNDGLSPATTLNYADQILDQPGNPSDIIFYSNRMTKAVGNITRLHGHGDLILTAQQLGQFGATPIIIMGRSGNLVLIRY